MLKIGAPLALLLFGVACAPTTQEAITPAGTALQAHSRASFVGCIHVTNLLHNTATPVESVVWRRAGLRDTPDCGPGAIPIEESAFLDYEQWAQRSRDAAPIPINQPRA